MSSKKSAAPKSTAVVPAKRQETDALVAANAPAKSLKATFLAQYQQPVQASRTLRMGASAVPTVTVSGIVTKTSFNNDKTKLQCSIVPTKVRSNGAPDIISSGVEGYSWLFPTSQPKVAARDAADDGPESGAKNAKNGKKEPAPPRTLALDSPSHKTVFLGDMPRVEFWLSGAGKGDAKAGMELVKAGMPVEITGVVARISDDGNQLWLNTASISPLLDGAMAHKAAETMINFFLKAEVAEQQVLPLSVSMGGFFGATYTDPDLEEQADAIRNRWTSVKDGTVAACESKAMGLRAEHGSDGEIMAGVLDSHADRIRASLPADFARGKPFFQPHLAHSPDRPRDTGALVHQIESMAYASNASINQLLDGDITNLPKSFAAPVFHSIEFNPTGTLMVCKYMLQFVGDTDKALEAVKSGRNPVLESRPLAAFGVKYLTRDFVSCTGVVAETKALKISEALVRYGRYAFTAGVNPREPNDDAVATPFVGSFAFDMVASLRNISVVVDEEFVRQNLADGNSQFVFESDGTVATLKDKEQNPISAGTGPKLKTHGYQSISEDSFRFSAALPDGKTGKEYRCWFEDAPKAIIDAVSNGDADPLSNAEEGKRFVQEAAASLSLDLATFLSQRSVVYCIAV